ncbi:MAG: carbohydrate porin [Desulfocapsaceae bacterium]
MNVLKKNDPSTQSARAQRWFAVLQQELIESYYRWRVSKELMITPDLQIIAGEDIGSSSNVCLVAGLRVGIVF